MLSIGTPAKLLAVQKDNSPVQYDLGPPPTPVAILVTALLLALLPLIVISQIAAHLRFDVVDDQMFGYFGWRILHGAVVYRDVWDNKPPGIYWMNALGFWIGRDSYWGVVVLCVIALLSTHVLFFAICASNYFRGSAAVATVIAGFFFTHGYFQGGTNRTETFLIPFELAAVLLYMRGHYRDRAWCWLLAGVCAGIAFLFKQVGLAAWGAMLVHLGILALLGEMRFRDALRRMGLMIAGAAIPVGLAALALASQGALHEALFATFGFNRYYMQKGDSSWTDTFVNRLLLYNHMKDQLTLPMLLALIAILHAVLWFLRPTQRAEEIERPIREFRPVCPHPVILFAIWWAVAMYGALISPHAFRHYLLPTFAPLLLLGAHTLNLLKTEARLIDRMQRRAWVIGAFVLMGYLALESAWNHFGEVSRVWVNRFLRGKQAPWEDVGDEVAKLSKPGDKVQFLGYMPGVYLRARRENVCRFTTSEKIGQLGKLVEYQQFELRDTLSKAAPEVFGLSAGDYAALTEPQSSDGSDWWSAWLREFIEKNYEQAAVVNIEDDNFIVFRRTLGK